MSSPTEALLEQQREANARQAIVLRDMADLLAEVAESGIEFEDDRMSYLVVQIDRDTWAKVKAIAR